MAILNRIRAALNPRVKLEDLEGDDAFTPLKDFGEYLGAGYGIETPRLRERREQMEGARQAELGIIEGRLGSQLDELLGMDAENQDHRAIVGGLADRAVIVGTMLKSRFPEMQEAGRQELATLMQAIRESGLSVETRRIRDAELDAAGIKDEWNALNTVADDLHRESTGFLDQRAAFGRILASAESPSAAGDLALIFNYMKLLDPGSTVREGEFANAQNAAGVGDQVAAMYNKLLTGERLLPDQRSDFLDRSRRLYSDAREQQLERNGRFLQRARDGGVREEMLGSLAIPVGMDEIEELPPTATAREEETHAARPELSEVAQAAEGIDTAIAAVPGLYNRAREGVGSMIGGISNYDEFARSVRWPISRLPARVAERAQEMMGEGDTIYADPQSGRVFVRHSDGEFSEVDTVTLGDVFRGRDNQGDVINEMTRPRNVGAIQRPTN